MKRLIQPNNYTCWSTCIKSILDDPEGFPKERDGLTMEEARDDWGNHHSEVVNWLNRELDIFLLRFDRLENKYELRCNYLASAKSPRGLLHTVVAYQDRVVHDPHPEGGGLVVGPDEWEVELFIRRFPDPRNKSF